MVRWHTVYYKLNSTVIVTCSIVYLFLVAKNCYNAASVQRAFVEANERFKNAVTRYSGRAGSALAVGRSSSGGFIREVRVLERS